MFVCACTCVVVSLLGHQLNVWVYIEEMHRVSCYSAPNLKSKFFSFLPLVCIFVYIS